MDRGGRSVAEVFEVVAVPLSAERPGWHEAAACRGDGADRWISVRGGSLEPLRRVCRVCPVAGLCLREALEEPATDRAVGPVRVGVAAAGWSAVRGVAADLGVVSDADHELLAAWLLDGVLKVSRSGAVLLVDDVA